MSRRKSENRDYTRSSFSVTALVIVMLVCVSFVPPFRVGDVVVRRANILSDIMPVEDSLTGTPSLEAMLDTSFLEGFIPPEPIAAAHPEEAYGEAGKAKPDLRPATDPVPAVSPGQSAATAETPEEMPDELTCAVVDNPELVAIEDFSPGSRMMNRFYNALLYETDKRVVRIAVLGDSFIEGDIITADMREQLQLAYGGNGVGFVPFSTPLSKYRGTVKHTFSGWDYYNIIKKKDVPAEYQDKFFVSGVLSIPKDGATAQYKGVKFRSRIENTSTVTLLFANREASTIDVAVNDSLRMSFTPPKSDSVGHITIRDGAISDLSVTIKNPAGFIGYGVVLEDSLGVSVHNHAVRSNSGIALFGTDAEVNRQINSLLNYDLIILQYGLNVMSNDIFDYGYYERHLGRIIEYIKQCFPGSAILVMSIGDRSTLKSGTAVTMPEVKAMIKTQRNAAVKGGVGFWNTLEGMGGENSMAEFVKNKWASKDHTHINYSGGKQIAESFVAYIKAAVESIREQDAVRAVEEADRHVRSGAALADSLYRVVMGIPAEQESAAGQKADGQNDEVFDGRIDWSTGRRIDPAANGSAAGEAASSVPTGKTGSARKDDSLKKQGEDAISRLDSLLSQDKKRLDSLEKSNRRRRK